MLLHPLEWTNWWTCQHFQYVVKHEQRQLIHNSWGIIPVLLLLSLLKVRCLGAAEHLVHWIKILGVSLCDPCAYRQMMKFTPLRPKWTLVDSSRFTDLESIIKSTVYNHDPSCNRGYTTQVTTSACSIKWAEWECIRACPPEHKYTPKYAY